MSLDFKIEQAYSPEEFKKAADAVVELLTVYLERCISADKTEIAVLPKQSSENVLKRWSFDHVTLDKPEALINIISDFIEQSQHLHHPHYMGHQVTSPLPVGALADFVSALMNNSCAIFEMAPIGVALEKIVLDWLSTKMGLPNTAGGCMTSGGSLGNLTALLAARGAQLEHLDNTDVDPDFRKWVALVPENTHYCIKRALIIMGHGQHSVIPVAVNARGQITKETATAAYDSALERGLYPFVITTNACSTTRGLFDNLSLVSEFAEKKGLWMHVDAAHGGITILSAKHKSLLAGIERADSIVVDFHKMMLTPSLATAVLFKQEKHAYLAMSTEAPYIFKQDESFTHEWQSTMKRSHECTKNTMALKVYLSLLYYGESYFEKYIDHAYDLAAWFYKQLVKASCFEVAFPPQSNIVCFRYKFPEHQLAQVNDLQTELRKRIVESESFYLVSATLNHIVYLRVSLMNPLTQKSHLQNLILMIKQKAVDLLDDQTN